MNKGITDITFYRSEDHLTGFVGFEKNGKPISHSSFPWGERFSDGVLEQVYNLVVRWAVDRGKQEDPDLLMLTLYPDLHDQVMVREFQTRHLAKKLLEIVDPGDGKQRRR